MAEYQIVPQTNKNVMEQFGMNKVRYNIYQKGIGLLDKSGMKIPFQAGMEIGLSQIYKPGVNIITTDAEIQRSSNDETFMLADKSSLLGTPVFSQLKFTDTTDSRDILATTTENIEHYFPIDTCLFTVSQEKNIVKTAIQGRNGTIKEYIGDGDYSISIKGIITGFNKIYPQNEVMNLLLFLQQPKELAIEVPYLNELFGITHLVVESYELPQEEGGQSYQSFTINAVSDETAYFTNINTTVK